MLMELSFNTYETITFISPPLQSLNFNSNSLFFSPRRLTLYGGRVSVSASFHRGESKPSSDSPQTNHDDQLSLAQVSISVFLRQEIGLSEADSVYVSENCPKYTRMIVEGVRDLEEWDSWKGNEGLGFSEKVVYMVKQKGDGGGKVAFLESLGLSLSSAMYLAHYVSSETLPKLLDKVQNNSLFQFVYILSKLQN